MSEPISEGLRAVQRLGSEAFAGTALASDVGPTVRRVGRRRVGRVVGAGLVAVALVAAVAAGAVAVGHRGQSASPADPPSVDAPVSITVPPGSRVGDVVSLLHLALGVPVADIQGLVANADALGLPAEANGVVDGWLAPGTYDLGAHPTPEAALSVMIQATSERLAAEGVPAGERERVLSLAALIENETVIDSNRPLVARVILNRIDAGMPLEYHSVFRDLTCGVVPSLAPSGDASSGSFPCDQFSTLVLPDLPATPDRAPSLASIRAAVHPEQGSWLYYTTVNPDTGEMRFATTAEENQANEDALSAWIKVGAEDLKAELEQLIEMQRLEDATDEGGA